MIAVADTTPLNYLVLIGLEDVPPKLFGSVLIPQAVAEELQRERTPPEVRAWIASPPPWLHVRQLEAVPVAPEGLGAGEWEAILLAERLRPGFVVMDDRAGRAEAERRGLRLIGTLGVLDIAAERGLIGMADALARLRRTSFRASDDLIRALLERDEQRRRSDGI